MSLRSYLDGALIVEQREGTRPPVLALHGWARDRRDLVGIVSGREALLPDLPGFGSSPPPPEAWGAVEYGASVAEFLTSHGQGPYVVVGHSFGGRVAVALAAEYPSLVSGMLLCGVPLVLIAPPARPKLAFRAARWAQRRGLLSDSVVERLRQRYGSADYNAAEGVMRAVLVRVIAEDYSELLARVQAPVGLCWGENDAAVPVEVARRAASLVTNLACFEIVPGVGHDVILQAPDRTRAALQCVVDAACTG